MSLHASELSLILFAGSSLIEAEEEAASDLKTVLLRRLRSYTERRGLSADLYDSESLEEVKFQTAEAALQTTEEVQVLVWRDKEMSASTSRDPLPLGTRDLAQLRTLLSIVFRWGTEPCLNYLARSSPIFSTGTKVSDLTSTELCFKRLSLLTARIVSLLFPNGIDGRIPQTLITTTVLQRHLADILHSALTVGWLPRHLAGSEIQPADSIRPLVMQILATLPPAETMVALGAIMSTKEKAVYVGQACGSLLSRQLLRPEGVRGLFASVFGEASSIVETSDLDKMEHVARVLTTVPAKMNAPDYFASIVPRVISLCEDDQSPAHRRAAAFTISRFLSNPDSKARPLVLQGLHQSLLLSSDASSTISSGSSLSTLVALITNTDPSPTLISTLLTPIVSPLYSLLYNLDSIKTSDPTLRESISSLLSTWARVVPTTESVEAIWRIVSDERISWQVGLDGSVRRVLDPDKAPSLSLFTPEELERAEKSGELDPNANFLDLYPDPQHFVSFLRSVDQQDIFAAMFGKILEAYRESRQASEQNTQQSLLYLQLIMQMQAELSDSKSSSNLFKKPAHILAFIKHALESARTPFEPLKEPTVENQFQKLRLDKEPKIIDLTEEADSDDEMSDSEAFTPDDEMTETSITLLLSILEGNEDLSARTEPILNDIFELLEPLANDGPSSIRPLAREARMVLTARLASSSTPRRSVSSKQDDAQEQYQKALKLLQDPILPVRAHGLLLLRQLVSPESTKGSQKRPKVVNPALVPAILSIFLQSIQDDEPYIFLNAVQGLAAMTDAIGKEILQGLVRDYSREVESGSLSQQEVDKRVRIGEALSLVIKRCGSALADDSDILVPPLFRVVQASFLPAALRTSALSLLADCVVTYPIALLPYIYDLCEGIIDLLQVESVTRKEAPEQKDKEQQEVEELSMDSHPTSTNSKFPPLRRAALHFFNLVVREITRLIYDSTVQKSILSDATIRRARITLAYMTTTAEDDVLRVMAREGGEILEQLERATVGL